MQNPDKVERLVVLNTPLGLKTKLRPELAAYKNKMAFLRPHPKASPHKPFLFLFDQNCHITLRDHIHSAEVVAFCSCTFNSPPHDWIQDQYCHSAFITSSCSSTNSSSTTQHAEEFHFCCRKSGLMALHTAQQAVHIRCSGILQRGTTSPIRKMI